MLRIGIIGCGKITQVRHIPEYKENEHVCFAGFFDLVKERAEEMARLHGGKAYDTYEEMIQDKEVDAVSVCAANHVHKEITVKALKAGKHVLCEKPMATSLEDCEEMVRVAKETGKFLMIGQNQRLTKTHRKAKELIEQGMIGDIITFQTQFGHRGPEVWSVDPGKNVWFFDKNKAVMGAMADLGIHKTDLIHYLSGQRIVETRAFIGTLDKRDEAGNFIGVDDNAICMYKLNSGALGTMAASWTYYGEEDNSFKLYGTKGIMKLYSDSKYSIIIETKDDEHIYYDIDQIQTNNNQTKSGVIDSFVDCLYTNTPPEISGEEVLAAMRVVFASIESSNTGKAVKIEQEG